MRSPHDGRNQEWARSANQILGALLASGVCLSFALLWWNRFLAVTNEGWHFFFAHQIIEGKIPYRDFYLFVPPLLQLEIAAAIKAFGDHLIATQVMGLVQVCFLAISLYLWMARVFPATDAFLGSVLAIILCMANRSEELQALHMSASFHATLAGCVATLAVNERNAKLKFAFIGGVLGGLAFLIKQTSGIATVLSLPILLGLATFRFQGSKKAAQVFVVFVGGCAIPLALVSYWLYLNGALGDAISDVLLRGPASKGSPLGMLVRVRTFLSEDVYLRRHALFAVLIFAGFLFLCRKGITSLPVRSHIQAIKLWALGLLSAGSIFLGWALSFSHSLHIPGTLMNFPANVGAFLAEIGSLVLFLIYFTQVVRNRLDPRQMQFFLMAGFSLAIAFLSSLSWPTSVGMIVPALSFVIATILSGCRDSEAGNLLRRMVAFACLLCMVQLTWQKCSSPFEWSGWREPDVHQANATMRYPELSGYRVSRQTARFVTRVTDDIDTHSAESERIFVYPDLPIFYLLSHRKPETFGYVHFVDVAPDFVDMADAGTLRKQPPAVIVYFKPTEEELREGEIYFRGGRRSAQRDLLAAISDLRPRYQLVDSITTPGTGKTVEILALR